MADPKNTNLWDKFKSLKANYKQIDIGLNLNTQNDILDNAETFKDNNETVGYTDIRYLTEKAKSETPREPTNEFQAAIISQAYIQANKKSNRKAVINRDEAMAVKQLYKKYKNDYIKMRRDIKLNVFQWTEKQCSFKLKEYLKRFPDQKIDWKKIN